MTSAAIKTRIRRASKLFEVLNALADGKARYGHEVAIAVDSPRYTVNMTLSKLRKIGFLDGRDDQPKKFSKGFLYKITPAGIEGIKTAWTRGEVRQRQREATRDDGAESRFHKWRENEKDRLIRLGCSKDYAAAWMAQWYEPVGPTLEAITGSAMVER